MLLLLLLVQEPCSGQDEKKERRHARTSSADTQRRVLSSWESPMEATDSGVVKVFHSKSRVSLAQFHSPKEAQSDRYVTQRSEARTEAFCCRSSRQGNEVSGDHDAVSAACC